MKRKFEFLEHTADIKMQVFGKTQKELFENAALGMAEIQKSKIKSQKSKSQFQIKKVIKLKSLNIEGLLVDFLSDILTHSDIEHAVFPKVKIKKLTEREIEAEIFGEKIEKFTEDIKAVTYHGLEVKKEKGNWQAKILFDI